MAENSKIEWTDHTWNSWRGCEKVSAGCDNCYAEAMSKRNPTVLGVWGADGSRAIASEDYWQLPHKWNRQAAREGRRHRVFSLSLGDWLEGRPELIEPRARLLQTVAETPYLDWLLLTKRPEGWADRLHDVVQANHEEGGLLASHWLDGQPPPNVWLGVSVEDQANADGRIPPLLEIPARVRFLSCEPLLGPLNLSRWVFNRRQAIRDAMNGPAALNCDQADTVITQALDWVIVGGESGPGARPMHPDWARSLRDQCMKAGVPYFFKQWGDWTRWGGRNHIEVLPPSKARPLHAWPDGSYSVHLGKHAAGRLLDGREWSQFPPS